MLVAVFAPLVTAIHLFVLSAVKVGDVVNPILSVPINVRVAVGTVRVPALFTTVAVIVYAAMLAEADCFPINVPVTANT